MSRPRLVPLWCAFLALVTSGVAVAVSLGAKEWKVSALVRMSETNQDERIARIARGHDPGFQFVPITSHYDGVYFYAIALDPLGRGEPAEAIRADRGPYRYGHPGYGWMAWAASIGNPDNVPTALLILALLGIAVGAAAASALARALGFTPWAGLVVAFNPGIVYAATVLTSETVGVALLMLGLLAWVRERRIIASVVLAAACLTKEPFLLVPVGIGLWELLQGLPWRGVRWGERIAAFGERVRSAELWRRASLLLAGPVVFGAWYVYLIVQFDVVPHSQVDDLTTWPFLGWWTTIRQAAQVGLGPAFTFDQVQIATATVALLAGSGVALATGLIGALRSRTPVSGPFIGLALVAFSLGYLGVYFPKDLIREISMPVSLLPFALAGRLAEPEVAPPAEPAWADIG